MLLFNNFIMANKPTIHLYLDTNIYLSFLHLTSEDLEELKKLEVLLKTGEVILYLPEQTNHEYNRNRENKINDALVRYKENKLEIQFPQMCKNYPEYEKLNQLIREFNKNKSILLDKMFKDIIDFNLEADKVFRELFTNAIYIPTTDELYNSAVKRYNLGNPPGKNKSYGDALIWESLLLKFPVNETLYFISSDKDYHSVLDDSLFNDFLWNEWRRAKNTPLRPYRKISIFFQEKFPHIKIAADYEKQKLITEFNGSSSFGNTRWNLSKLTKFNEFSKDELEQIIYGCINNSQILWIRDDEDIKKTLKELIEPHLKKIDPAILERFNNIYKYF